MILKSQINLMLPETHIHAHWPYQFNYQKLTVMSQYDTELWVLKSRWNFNIKSHNIKAENLSMKYTNTYSFDQIHVNETEKRRNRRMYLLIINNNIYYKASPSFCFVLCCVVLYIVCWWYCVENDAELPKKKRSFLLF